MHSIRLQKLPSGTGGNNSVLGYFRTRALRRCEWLLCPISRRFARFSVVVFGFFAFQQKERGFDLRPSVPFVRGLGKQHRSWALFFLLFALEDPGGIFLLLLLCPSWPIVREQECRVVWYPELGLIGGTEDNNISQDMGPGFTGLALLRQQYRPSTGQDRYSILSAPWRYNDKRQQGGSNLFESRFFHSLGKQKMVCRNVIGNSFSIVFWYIFFFLLFIISLTVLYWIWLMINSALSYLLLIFQNSVNLNVERTIQICLKLFQMIGSKT